MVRFLVFCSRILAQNLCSMKAICQRVAAAAGLCFQKGFVPVLRSPGSVIHYQYLGNVVVFFVHCIAFENL